MGLSFNDFVKNSTELTNLNLSDEFYVQSDGIDSKITFQNLAGNLNIISVTYGELLDLISTNSLIPGQQYEISNYRTTYYMPNTNPPELIACDVEPLIVQASSTNSLFAEARSASYPKDIIYYDIENNQTYCTGSSRGYIYRRIDTKYNNDIGMDFRNVKFRRWQLNITDVWTGSVSYPRGYTVVKSGSNELYTSLTGSNLNNALTTSKWKRFEWDNYQYVGVTPNTWIIGGWGLTSSLAVSSSYEDFHLFNTTPTKTRNTVNWDKVHNNTLVPVNRTTGEQFTGRVVSASLDIIQSLSSTFFHETYSDGWFNVLLVEGVKNNKCGGGFHDNVIGCAQDNIFGNNFHGNSIGLTTNTTWGYDNKYNSIYRCFANEIRSEFETNFILEFHDNKIGYGFWANAIYAMRSNNVLACFQGNVVGDVFKGNTLVGVLGLKTNNIGNNFENNFINDDFIDNNIGNSCQNNIMGVGFRLNNIGINFKNNNLKYRFRQNTVGNNFQYNNANCEILAQNLTGSTIVYSTYSKDIVKNQSGTLLVAWWNTSNTYTSSAITT